MQYKTPRIEAEYKELEILNPRLHALLEMVDLYSSIEFGIPVMVTCIFRTQAENDALYAETPPDKRPPSSPHCRYEAADLRSLCYTDQQITKIETLVNLVTVYGGQRRACLYHQVIGNARHLHIQCNPGEKSGAV